MRLWRFCLGCYRDARWDGASRWEAFSYATQTHRRFPGGHSVSNPHSNDFMLPNQES